MQQRHEIRLSVPNEPSSIGVVRRSVLGLAEICGEDEVNELAVIFSELVTNAVRHSGRGRDSPVEVTLVVDGGQTYGSVVDRGPGFDPDGLWNRSIVEEGGLGLRIVSAMASRWGVRRNRGTEVWFEF